MDIPVSFEISLWTETAITDFQITNRSHVKLNFAMKPIALDNVDMSEIWTDQRLGLQEVQYALVGGEEQFLKLQNDGNNICTDQTVITAC